MTLLMGTDHPPGSRMSNRITRRRPSGRATVMRLIAATVAVGVAVACSSDKVIAPSGPKVSVCHTEAAVSTIGEIFLSELPEHRRNGDYVARLEVSRTNVAGDSIHFTRITDALAVARAGRLARNESETAACRITIAVAPGSFTGSTAPSDDPAAERFPLVVDVPDISLIGALKMAVDAGGRATGGSQTADATTITANPALIISGGDNSRTAISEELFIVNAHPVGSKGNGAVIEGFVLQNGRAPDATVVGGQGVLSMRARNLVIRGNRFEGTFTEALDLRASSALVDRNYVTGRAASCDFCLGGPAGEFDVRNNRLNGPGGLPGIFTVPASVVPVPDIVEQYVLPTSALVTATITNNEVRGHLSKPVGVGIRIGAVGPFAPIEGTSRITITGNSVINNTFGMIFEAAFPVAGSVLRGDLDIKTSGNTFSQSCQNDVFVSFTRHISGLGLVSPFPSFLKSSTYSITSAGDLPLDKAWFTNPAGYGNTLIVNGQTMPNVSNAAYDAARVCP